MGDGEGRGGSRQRCAEVRRLTANSGGALIGSNRSATGQFDFRIFFLISRQDIPRPTRLVPVASCMVATR